MLTWIEEEQLRDLSRGVPYATGLRLLTTPDGRSRDLSDFCDRLAALAPQIRVTRAEGEPENLPVIILPNGLRYCGVPHGTEMGPFFEALSGRIPAPSEGLLKRLSVLTLPAALDVFVAPHCIHCPQAVRTLMPLVAASPRIKMTVIDGTLFSEVAEQAGVKAAPTAVLDGRFRWTGTIPLDELVALISTRDPLTLGPASLEVMLKEGAARRLAQMMAEAGALIPALMDLLCHDKWPLRLGAMVAVEELGEMRPALAAQALEGLWERFEGASDPVKGDILFLCGEVGGRGLVERVKRVADNTHSVEVGEAAVEAMEKLMQKPGE
jgi:hypothetical protein